MPEASGSLRLATLVLVASVVLSACGSTESQPSVPGTLETATQLTLGADATLEDETTPVKVCLNPDGVCVPSGYLVDECFVYDHIEAFVEEVPIPQVSTGGWAGDRCTYPSFELADLGRHASSGIHELTIRIGRGAATATVGDWLVERTLAVPDTLVKGTDVLVGVMPRVGERERLGRPGTGFARPGAYFLYDDVARDHAWYKARYPSTDPDATGIAPSFGDIAPEAWSDDGFVLNVPTTMPPGIGRFGLGEGGALVDVMSCPFSGCVVTVNRSVEVAGVSIAEP